MKRCIVLLRCSTDLQDEEFTAQRADVEHYISARGLSVAPDDWRPEVAVSGACRKRPVLERIIDEAERGEVSHLLCADFDRAGRSGSRTCVMVEDLVDDYGVTVVFVRERWTLTAPLTFDNKVLMLAKSIGGMAKLDSGSHATAAGLNGWDLDGVAVPPGTPGAVRVSVKKRKKVGIRGLEWTADNDNALLAFTSQHVSPETIAKERKLKVGRWRMLDADGGIATKTRQPGVRWGLVSCVPSPRAMRARIEKLSVKPG